MIGLRAGYLAAPSEPAWDVYERKANGGPDATISGLYARVVIGGTWRRQTAGVPDRSGTAFLVTAGAETWHRMW